MTLHIDFKCGIEKCPYSKKIVTASKAEIISHLLDHDYSVLLDECVKYRIIKDKTQRRNPRWIAENLTEIFISGADE